MSTALDGLEDVFAITLRSMARAPTEDELEDFFFDIEDDLDEAQVLILEPDALADVPSGHAAVVSLIRGAGEANRCNPDEWGTYMIADGLITGGDPLLPRVILNACEDQSARTDRAFIALSFADPQTLDVSSREIEMFAWDTANRRNNFYRTHPMSDSSEGVWVITNPTEIQSDHLGGCQACHRGPTSTPDDALENVPLLPVMNELVQPWSHWAAPGFAFEEFGEVNRNLLPDPASMCRMPGESGEAPVCCEESDLAACGESERQPTADRRRLERVIAANASFPSIMAKEGFAFYRQFLFGADRFENIIRAGANRVQMARTRDWDQEPADVTLAMSHLRPLFCDEQLNYAGEENISGQLNMGAAVDVSLQMLYRRLPGGTAWPWSWTTSPRQALNVGPARDWMDRLSLVPMRGQSAVIYEELLVERRGYFTAPELIQLHALDWQTPVMSDARCSMWEELWASNPSVQADNLLDAVRELFDQAILRGLGTELPEQARVPGFVLVVDRLGAEQRQALREGTELPVVDCPTRNGCDVSPCDAQGICVMNHLSFGVKIDNYLGSFNGGNVRGRTESGRALLKQERTRRLRRVVREFPAEPALDPDEMALLRMSE